MNIVSLLFEKCPNCHKGRMFKSKNIFNLKMNTSCSKCANDFEREPGFYTGAMYISYGLSLAEVVMVYVICRIFGAATFDYWIMVAIGAVLLTLITFNFRVSRAVWLSIFSSNN